MPNPRKPDELKKRLGTYRADRAENYTPDTENEAVTLYREAVNDAWLRASRGDGANVEYLRTAERVLADNGLVMPDGRPWNGSALVDLLVRARAKAHP
jgi:hypothetical protein